MGAGGKGAPRQQHGSILLIPATHSRQEQWIPPALGPLYVSSDFRHQRDHCPPSDLGMGSKDGMKCFEVFSFDNFYIRD